MTWNPSVCSVVKDSLLCPTTEEQTLPIVHGNDRVEWFIQVSDEIFWEIGDKAGGAPRAHVLMKAGDVAAMPADIRHQGFSPKRSMLIVWENNNDRLPAMRNPMMQEPGIYRGLRNVLAMSAIRSQEC